MRKSQIFSALLSYEILNKADEYKKNEFEPQN